MSPKKSEPSENTEATEETVTVSKTQLDALLARLDALEKQKPEDIEISADLPAAQALRPGQYVNIAAPNQAPDLRKVRWTKSAIEKEYPMVEFQPLINVTVAPHGVPWDLSVDRGPVRVPSIVRDFHDNEYQRIRHQYDRYKPESAIEVIDSIQRSKENQGVPVWGRLHLVGVGLAMGDDQPGVVVPPPTETKA